MSLKIKKLKNQVKIVLQQTPQTRNSDIALTIEIWKRFYPFKLFTISARRMRGDGRKAIYIDSLYDLPSQDAIKRIRARFCQKGKRWAYPTKLFVALKRGMKEDNWRQTLSYPVGTEVLYPIKEGGYIEKLRIQKGLI